MSKGQYNPTPPVIAASGVADLQLDVNGNLKTTGTSSGSGATADQVQGNSAANTTDVGNPVKVGGRFNTTPPTLTDGQRGDITLGSRGALKVQVHASNSVTAVNTLADNVDGVAVSATADKFAVENRATRFNGTSWDREYSNVDGTILASGARTTTQTSADQTNYNGKGIHVVLDMTIVGTGSVTLSINGKDAVSGKYYTILAGAAVVTNSTNVYKVHPGLPATANVSANDLIPRTFQIVVTANNANSATYSVGYSLIV